MAKSSLKGKNILFIAYFFPPAESTEVPGAMRTIKFIRNMENGERHVLTTPPRIDESRSALRHIQLPTSDEKIHRIKPWDAFKLLLSLRSTLKGILKRQPQQGPAQQPSGATATFKSHEDSAGPASKAQRLKDFIYNLCYFPDQAGPWILPAFFYGKKLVSKQNIDVIFATGSPWSGLFVGYLISKATGKPLIVDFRDPWMNNPFHQSKGALLDRWSVKMERAIVQQASAVSLNTEPLMEEFLERYPDAPRDKFFAMPNGFDLSDIEGVSLQPATANDDFITFCHAGFLYGVRDPAVLLDAIRAANQSVGASGKKLRFRQIGEVQLGYDIRARYADMLADGALILDAARPYQACLSELAQSDWVVNVQPATRSQVPSKLYDYLAINKPILNITPRDGALGRIVAKHGLGLLFDFNELEKLTKELVDMAKGSSSSQTFSGYPARESFNCSAITQALVKRIEQVSKA